jgi:hypothetical protein
LRRRRGWRTSRARRIGRNPWTTKPAKPSAVYEAEPTSRAGAIAFLRFVADFLEENGVNDTLLEDVFPNAIRAAADFFEGEA